jgi:CRP/FNR family transcriptional regulator, dissimilatory nitrate respiration regulator
MNPLLDGLPRTLRELPAGAAVFRRGDRVSAMYFVEAGQVELSRTLDNGTTLPLASYGAGQLLAEASLFSTTYHCDAVPSLPTRLWRVAKPGLLQALCAAPQAMLALLVQQAQAIQALRAAAELRNLRPLSVRVLAWLELQPTDPAGWVAPVHSWKTTSQTLGASHEALYRCLATLENGGLIEREAGRIRRAAGQG